MNIIGYKIRKKHRIIAYWWFRWICLVVGAYFIYTAKSADEVVSYSYSFGMLVFLLTLAIDNLTWRKGWNRYIKKR